MPLEADGEEGVGAVLMAMRLLVRQAANMLPSSVVLEGAAVVILMLQDKIHQHQSPNISTPQLYIQSAVVEDGIPW